MSNVLFATTSERDYDMDRLLLLENMLNTKYGEYVLAEGGHCSCYDFDETEWNCIKVTEELNELLEKACYGLRVRLKEFFKNY